MRAVTITAPGGPEQLTVTTLPDLAPGPHEVVLDVRYIGVNRADLLQRTGFYPPAAGAPDWPGLEVSGVIRTLGSAVTDWQVGDRVAALLDGGGYADEVCTTATQLLPVPDGLDMAEAAALPEAACTAWSNLVDTARLVAGEWVLIHGGSGGIGTVAIQLAAALGARVAATAGGPERTARCRELGAQLAIDHRSEDFVAAIREASGAGANVILDVIGAAYLDRNLAALAPDGRLVVIGLQRGARAQIDLGRLLARRASVFGTTLRSRSTTAKARIVAAVRERVWPMVADGRVRPIVHSVLPMTHAADAHRLLESGEVFGKVLLTP